MRVNPEDHPDIEIERFEPHMANGHEYLVLSEELRRQPQQIDESIPRPVAQLACAKDIKPEPISWLWAGHLARGKLHLVAGQPGMGKTSVGMKIGATVSSGTSWPDGTQSPQGRVVIWSGEDDPADTLIPRLETSGADLRFVHFVSTVVDDGQRRPFDPATDVDALEAGIAAAGGASLIIVDPIVSAASGDSHKNSETRRGLQPLVDMAARINAALIGITHFTKGSEGRSPIDRVTGSVAFGALPRVVFVAAKQQETEDGRHTRVFMRAKSNIGPDNGGFTYDLQLSPMFERPDIIASTVVWGEAVSGSARDVLAVAETSADSEDAGRLREASDWLLDHLLTGPRPAKQCIRSAAEAGHSKRTLDRAKADLGVSSMKKENGWVWGLPQDRQDDSKDATQTTVGNLGNLGALQQNQQVTDTQDRHQGQDCQGRQDCHGKNRGEVDGERAAP